MSQLGFSSIHVNNCDSCSIAKSHTLPFTLSEKRTTAPFQLIHSDLWGPTAVPSFAGFHSESLYFSAYRIFLVLKFRDVLELM